MEAYLTTHVNKSGAHVVIVSVSYDLRVGQYRELEKLTLTELTFVQSSKQPRLPDRLQVSPQR